MPTNPTPTQQGETLEGCPLCACKVFKERFEKFSATTQGILGFSYRCPKCRSQFAVFGKSEAEAMKVWNTRAAVAGPRRDVLTLITHERERQITEEGYDANHDDGDGHDGGELAQAAAAYALGGGQITNIFEDRTIDIWPTSWGAEEDTIKRKPRIRQLVIAGALIVAEIERLQRADGDAAATSSPAPAEKLPLPTDYECIAPSEQAYVINLPRGICDADKQEVARLHLNLCLRCQELAGGVVPAERKREIFDAGFSAESARVAGEQDE